MLTKIHKQVNDYMIYAVALLQIEDCQQKLHSKLMHYNEQTKQYQLEVGYVNGQGICATYLVWINIIITELK